MWSGRLLWRPDQYSRNFQSYSKETIIANFYFLKPSLKLKKRLAFDLWLLG